MHRLLIINPLPPTSSVSVPTHHFLVMLDDRLVASNQKQEPLAGEPGEIVPLRLTAMHYGTRPGGFKTSNHSILHKLKSE